jgi:nucleoside-diphosphate-sugar epimerase
VIVPMIGRVAVVGASSQIGRTLLSQLTAAGYLTYRIGRADKNTTEVITTYIFNDSSCTFSPNLDFVDAVISLAPLPSIPVVIKMALSLGAKRIIAFGSTGRFSKVESSSAIEKDFVVQQERAETLFSSQCEEAGIRWTLFRPTMIYGAVADQNVSFIKSMIRSYGFFPIPFRANGLRQPVHIDDLAYSCVSALHHEATCNKEYNLGGGEVLSFTNFVKRIFEAEGRRAILVPLPMWLFSLLISIAKKFPEAAFVKKEMVERMYRDLTVDNYAAMVDFGYCPKAFVPISDSAKLKS